MNPTIENPTNNELPKVITEPTEQTTTFARTEEHGSTIARWDAAAMHVRTSLDPQTSVGRARITQCMDIADKQIVQASGEIYEITDYFAHVVELPVEETGEIVSRLRLVMITAAGMTISTCSEIFIRSFSFIVGCLGSKHWPQNPRIKITMRQSRTNAARNYATCIEVAQELPDKKRSK